MSRTITITENNRTGKTLVYREALKLEEQARRVSHRKFSMLWEK